MEWLTPDTDVPVRQGDMLIRRDPKNGNIEETYIIITADCDISKKKFGAQLAGLRVISHDHYLSVIWGEKKLSKAVKDEREKTRDQIAKWHSILINNKSTITEDAAVEWLLREGPDKIIESLSIPADKKSKVQRSLSASYNAFKILDSESLETDLQKFIHFKANSEEKEFSAVLNTTVNSAQLESLPDDTFFIPELPASGQSAIIMLREIIGLPPELIRYKAPEANARQHLLRVARLKPEIKYAVSQAFGSLYSRIGMSAEYEARRKTAIQKINGNGWNVGC